MVRIVTIAPDLSRGDRYAVRIVTIAPDLSRGDRYGPDRNDRTGFIER
jgi:hypothetical protein